MSTILSCRDALHAGEALYECAYSASTSTRATVDVSTATLVSLWDAGRLDDADRQPEHLKHVSTHSTLHDPTWSDQLSPHLHRNKQLQETLLQKEEELARLQEENHKLKVCLNSSYVKSLEEKSKRLLSLQRSSDLRHRKRVLYEDGDFLNVSRMLQDGKGKRTCRNLSLEFCSAEEMAATPPLDSWILETLGLQDEDTINLDNSFSSPTTDYTASFGSPVPSSDHFSPGMQSSATCSPYSDICCEYSSARDSSSSYGIDTSTEYQTIDPSALYTVTSSQVSALPSPFPFGHFSPPRAASTPRHSHAARHDSASSSGDGGTPFYMPYTARGRTDLAFSMSLSPQSSVKTHTFPQGQAFTRKDSQGGWNFTWVPKQCC